MTLVRSCSVSLFALLLLSWGVGCDSGNGDKDGEQDVCANGACATVDVEASVDAPVGADASPDVSQPAEEILLSDTAVADPDVEPVAEITAVEDVPPVSTDIVIPMAVLSTTAKFFTHQWHNVTIKYFGVLDADGGVHMAFDACDVCYGAKKGYSQQGDLMVCNNCGNKFAITGIGTENKGGGCWPGFLEVTLTETDEIIDPAVLEAGSWYFE